MKINPVIIHDTANEWVKGKPEPADKMRKKHNPLVGLWSRDDLSRRRKTVADFLGQVHGLSKLFDIPLPDGRGHPFASYSRSGHLGNLSSMEKKSAWALGLEQREAS